MDDEKKLVGLIAYRFAKGIKEEKPIETLEYIDNFIKKIGD